MIVGVGTDIVSISRIEKAYKKQGAKFIERILTAKEITICKQKQENEIVNFLAKRFAAKEAISKALGVGIGGVLSFQGICITNNHKGKPEVNVKGFENLNIQISLSDEKEEYAIAFAIAEK